ncbi:hypothetical protein [Paenibacillus artemisiicola]|nr:hypothetical protein [Paenibacillus artemisiicola]
MDGMNDGFRDRAAGAGADAGGERGLAPARMNRQALLLPLL